MTKKKIEKMNQKNKIEVLQLSKHQEYLKRRKKQIFCQRFYKKELSLTGLFRNSNTVWTVTSLKSEGQFFPTNNNQWPPIDQQQTKKNVAFTLPPENEQICIFKDLVFYNAIKCLVWKTQNRCDVHLEFRQLDNYQNLCQRKLKIYIDSLMLQKNTEKTRDLRANLSKYLNMKQKSCSDIGLIQKKSSQINYCQNIFNTDDFKKFTEYIDFNEPQQMKLPLFHNKQAQEFDFKAQGIDLKDINKRQSFLNCFNEKILSNFCESLPCFSIIESNDNYKTIDMVESQVGKSFSISDIKGVFEVTRFSFNNAMMKYIGLKSLPIQTQSEGFDQFDYIVTRNWIGLTNKLLDLKLNDQISSVDLSENELHVLRLNDKTGSGNFKVHKKHYLDNNGLNQELTFVYHRFLPEVNMAI